MGKGRQILEEDKKRRGKMQKIENRREEKKRVVERGEKEEGQKKGSPQSQTWVL